MNLLRLVFEAHGVEERGTHGKLWHLADLQVLGHGVFDVMRRVLLGIVTQQQLGQRAHLSRSSVIIPSLIALQKKSHGSKCENGRGLVFQTHLKVFLAGVVGAVGTLVHLHHEEEVAHLSQLEFGGLFSVDDRRPRHLAASEVSAGQTGRARDQRAGRLVLAEPPLRSGKEGAGFPVGHDLVEDAELPLHVRDEGLDAKPEGKKSDVKD